MRVLAWRLAVAVDAVCILDWMQVVRLPLGDLAARLGSPQAAEELSAAAGVACVLLEDAHAVVPPFGHSLPHCAVVAVRQDATLPEVVDVAADSEEEAERVVEAIKRNPIAAMVLVQLLRHNVGVGVEDGLFAESLAYSSLQHGAEFRAWLSAWRSQARKPRPPASAPAAIVERAGAELRITLNRPEKRNAYAADVRDALCEGLALAVADDSIRRVVLQGAGACFSAGGDLDEFGAARDAALAHASRMTRSAAPLMHRLRHRVEARLHGACIGAGIELPAFAGRVVAREDAFFQLPEVGMGLIPGAGGTVSILRRIGRRRLAYMALTGTRVTASTAWAWGLVDVVE